MDFIDVAEDCLFFGSRERGKRHLEMGYCRDRGPLVGIGVSDLRSSSNVTG